jgi:hypothetical protein
LPQKLVNIDLLNSLHEYHETWICRGIQTSLAHQIPGGLDATQVAHRIPDGLDATQVAPQIPDGLDVCWTEAAMPPVGHGTDNTKGAARPTLILNYDEVNIDDEGAKQEVSEKVHKFWTWVDQRKNAWS